MSINGVAYLTWSTGGDVLAARMERVATTFNGVPGPLDIDPAAVAGTGTGRPKVAVAADGVATVVWGEGGHAYARRIFELRLSTAPQDLGAGADEPDISSEDDSSFAWVVFRQDGQTIARRLVGSQFDTPVSLQAAEGSEAPRVAINGRGVGYAGVAGTASAGAYGAVLKDDLFNPAVLLGGGFAAPAPVPAVAESGDGLIAFQQGDATGARSVVARPYDYVPASRLVTQPGAPAVLSDPALGQTDASRGLEAAADRAGDVAIAFVQGDGDGRQIVAASLDRAPGSFRASTSTKWRKFARPPLKWGTAFELWGPLTYQVLIDNKPVAQTTSTGVTVPIVIADGLHRWRVVATDIRGQSASTPSRNLRVDATAPKVTYKISGAAQARQAGEGRRPGHRRQRDGRPGLGARPRAHLLRRRLTGGHRPEGDPSLRALGQGHGAHQRRRQGGQRGRQDAGRSRSTSSPRRSIDRKSSQRAGYRSSRRSRRPSRNVGCRAVRVPSGEPELVRAAAAGDPAALAALWDAYGPRVFAFCQRVLGRADAAADAAQDAFLLAHAELGRLARAGESFGTAVFQAARTTCFELLARDRARAARAAGRPRACRPPPRACARSSAPRSPSAASRGCATPRSPPCWGSAPRASAPCWRGHGCACTTSCTAPPWPPRRCVRPTARTSSRCWRPRPTASSARPMPAGPTRTSRAARPARARGAPWTRRPPPTPPGRRPSRPRGWGRRRWPRSA